MALSRRTGTRFQASIWPGFVDAMTGLLLVLMFVLTIFMIVQFVLRETISGQADKLDALSTEVAALAQALGLEQERTEALTDRVGELTATLGDARQREEEQAALIASLRIARAEQDAALSDARSRITRFEEQVAGLLAERDTNLGTIADLEGQRDTLLSEQEQLNLALAGLRDEVDDAAEAARLAAARREALEALIADLRRRYDDGQQEIATLSGQVTNLETQLSEEEQLRLAEAAAAEALRDRLKNADAELTAMTLALEEERRRAEETLTLLAAVEDTQQDLDIQLAAALLAQDQLGDDLTAALLAGDEKDARIAVLESQLSEIEQSNEVTRSQLSTLEAQLAAALADAEGKGAELDTLRLQLSETQGAQDRLTVETKSLETQLAEALAAKVAAENEAVENSKLIADLQSRLTLREDALAKAQRQLTELQVANEAAQAEARDADDVRQALAAALAAKLAAEQDVKAQLTESEQREVLLAEARKRLAEQKEVATEAQKQQALLNRQVAALRQQLGELQALLDDAKAREAASDVQIQALGQDLNLALARAAAEERRRRLLEEEERKRLEAEAEDLQKYRSEFFGRLRDVLGTQEGVRIVGDRFVFSSEVLFAPAQADLEEDGKAELAKVVAILRNVVNEIPKGIDWVLQVDGHTDNVPIRNSVKFADNWELSQARALSVVRYMVEELDLPPERLSANGFGEFQPVSTGDTPEARAQNRRIELKFTEK